MLGRPMKGILFLLLLGGMFVAGVTLDVDFYHKYGMSLVGEKYDVPAEEAMLAQRQDSLLDRVWAVGFTYLFPFCIGVITYFTGFLLKGKLLSLLVGMHLLSDPAMMPVYVKDIGYCFAIVAGLLNIVVMLDAYDTGWNEEMLEREGHGAV